MGALKVHIVIINQKLLEPTTKAFQFMSSKINFLMNIRATFVGKGKIYILRE